MDYISIVAAIILPLVALLYYYLTKNYGYWEKKGVPYIKGALPGVGNVSPLIFMRQNIFQIWEEFYNKMPGCSLVGFYFLREPALLIRDPELVKAVLQTDFTNFSANGIVIEPEADPLLSVNPSVLNGEEWKSARQQLGSAFTPGKLKFMYSSIGTVCANFVKYLHEQTKKGTNEIVDIELKATFARFTAEVVASAAFGFEGESFKDKDGIFVDLGKRIFEPTYVKGIKQLIVLFVPGMAKLFSAGLIEPKIDTYFRKIVKDVLKYRFENNVQRNDFLQLMINLNKTAAALNGSSGKNVDDDTITSHAASFFIDGYETSSITMAFFAYQLARHSEVQQRVREEIRAAVEQHGGLTYDALQQTKYMDQAFNESMRLYPGDGSMFKVCTGETVLEGSDGVVCKVEPGTPVMISVQGLHMDPEYWPDPHKFDPERFSDENKHSINKYAFLPFGEGPRNCIGSKMAILQMKAAVAAMLINFSLKLSPKTQLPIKLDPCYLLPSVVGGLWVELKPL